MINEILSKVGVSQAKKGRKYGVHRIMIGKVLKKSKVDWIKPKLGSKVISSPKREGHKGSQNS